LTAKNRKNGDINAGSVSNLYKKKAQIRAKKLKFDEIRRLLKKIVKKMISYRHF